MPNAYPLPRAVGMHLLSKWVYSKKRCSSVCIVQTYLFLRVVATWTLITCTSINRSRSRIIFHSLWELPKRMSMPWVEVFSQLRWRYPPKLKIRRILVPAIRPSRGLSSKILDQYVPTRSKTFKTAICGISPLRRMATRSPSQTLFGLKISWHNQPALVSPK